ncbi:MAG: hypothetical protein OXT09_19265, partial [Myxococcales bacterium]|nr:hypothetical protein [Myxococcales bacterium]
FAAAMGQPDYQDCVAGAQTGGTCDDCGGGGGGGIISVLSVASSIDPLADFNVGGALGGVCPVCNGEAGGGAGELQLDGAYVGEFCDGFDNDFDGAVDEDLGQQSCGLGGCAQDIAACSAGVPVTCSPMVEPTDPTCSADPDGARPRIAVVLDTSASMLLSLDGYPTFGDGSVDHPGVDTDGDLQPNDSRMFLAREALAQVTSAYPEIDFALARYHQNQSVDRSCQTARWFECQDLVASYDEPADNTGTVACSAEINATDSLDVRPTSVGGEECINYAGSCGPPRRGADVLSGFGTPTRDLVRWLDGRETAFNADETPGNVCDHLGGGDCEVRATGPTPLEGSLLAVEDYVVPIRAVDPATGCRGYSVILVTDGAESCNGDPVAAAARLHGMFGIEVYVVAVSVLPQEQASLDALAMAGSGDARGATFVNAPEELVPALTDIIAGSIRSEDCNGADDDCDGAIDEDFPGLGDGCDDGNVGVCRGEGTIVCNGAGDGTECDITMPGGSPDDESCNFLDDDCDLFIDEGLSCTTTTCTELGAEICNGADDDCDGQVDEGDPDGGAACGSDEGVCEPGQTRCVAGMLRCVGGVEPTMEICDGDDDDCDGEIDDDAPCPPGNVCIDAACRRRCDPQMEFTCPVGMLCTEVTEPEQDAGSYCLPSACAVCGPGEVCDGERCVDLCEGVSCDEGESCVDGDCRDCHFVGCPTGEVCFASECQADPCADVSCAEGEACMNGSCAASCDDADCGVGDRCGEGGSCEPDPCAMVACRGAEVCIEGECSDNPCLGMQCLGGDVCVPAMGCIDDPCPLTTCPEGRSCALDVSGRVQCVSADVPVKSGARPDQGVEAEDGRFVTAAGGGLVTCAVGSASGTGSGAGMWLAGVVLFWWRRRR